MTNRQREGFGGHVGDGGTLVIGDGGSAGIGDGGSAFWRPMRPTILLALALTACTPATMVGLPASPQAAADRTTLDEQALLAVELAYKGARIAVEIYVDSGRCVSTCATHFRDLNRRAYAAVQAARTAYRAGNASGYLAALSEGRSLANQLLTLTGRNN